MFEATIIDVDGHNVAHLQLSREEDLGLYLQPGQTYADGHLPLVPTPLTWTQVQA